MTKLNTMLMRIEITICDRVYRPRSFMGIEGVLIGFESNILFITSGLLDTGQ